MARSAPIRSQATHFSAEPALTNTRAPRARASWMAVVPMPLDPPWIRIDSPAARRPRSNTLVHTVKNVSGMAAAATRSRPRGTGRHCGAGATQYSAYPPPATSAQTASPSCHSDTEDPTPAIVPATSSPGMSDAPGGGGYLPRRCMTSGRFTPAAATLISTSPADGAGRGRSTGTNTSGSPGSRISIAITFTAHSGSADLQVCAQRRPEGLHYDDPFTDCHTSDAPMSVSLTS